MAMTSWTVADLAELTSKAIDLMAVAEPVYCEHCGIVEIAVVDKYCSACANEICEYLYGAYYDTLAEEYMEVLRVQEGLY